MDIDLLADCTIEREMPVSLGPLARSVDDLILCCKALFGHFDEDPLRNAQPWNDQFFNKFDNNKKQKLNIAYVNSDKEYNFVPMNQNTIDEVVDELKGRGHNLIKFDFD
jgi:Asp-tRNA(Asn)/Glu-tRNA(Gln) amidotransferase A subunit family amidase